MGPAKNNGHWTGLAGGLWSLTAISVGGLTLRCSSCSRGKAGDHERGKDPLGGVQAQTGVRQPVASSQQPAASSNRESTVPACPVAEATRAELLD
jgi:hypothetical protein